MDESFNHRGAGGTLVISAITAVIAGARPPRGYFHRLLTDGGTLGKGIHLNNTPES